MGSTQRGTIYQMLKTNKTGSKVTDSAQRGAEITSTTPQRGHGSIAVSTQRSAAGSFSPSVHRRSEPANAFVPPSSAGYARSTSPEPGPSFSGAPIPKGTENRSKSEVYRHSSLHRKIQQSQTPSPYAVQTQRNISPPREDLTRRGGESKSGRDTSNRYSIPGAKSSRQLSFVDQKDNVQTLQEDPPSKVQYPQGVRVPRRTLVYPKDEAVQTDPIRKSMTTAEIRPPRKPSSPERGSGRIYTDSRTAQKRIPGQESEVGHHSSIYTEPKPMQRDRNMESSLRLSVLKDLDGGHRVSMRLDPESTRKQSAYTVSKPSSKVLISSEVEANVKSSVRGDGEVSRRVTISSGVQPVQSANHRTSRAVSESAPKSSMFTSPEPIYKQRTQRPSESAHLSPDPILKYPEPSPHPSVHAKVELTPRPLPPRSLPRYGPECSWWALLNTESEKPQSWPTTPDFEPTYPPPIDDALSFFEMDLSPFYEDLMFQREKASPSPPATPPPPPQSPKLPSWTPLREVPQASKCTCKQPIQRFSAFFLGM